nr:DUF4258 domain-containing protein [Methylobacterium sp. ARG-1]
MSPIQIRWSDHALARMRMRAIEAAWVERTIRNPEVIEPDPVQRGRVRVFAAVPERDGRILSVIDEPLEGDEIAVVTALLDRDAPARGNRPDDIRIRSGGRRPLHPSRRCACHRE